MWECKYGKEPLDIRLLVLRFLQKSPLILLTAFLGALCVGGPYFLTKVTFGPAKEYEAVTDFYIDYAVQANGEEYTYFNQTTWTQLITDDVFTDKILEHMAEAGESAGITKPQLREYLYATMLSDTRIVTTTVTTNEPELTMKIEKALVLAMEAFGEEQKEIAGVRILQEPKEASLVAADVRTFRACMLGAVLFVFVTVLYLLIYFVLDEGIYIPATFERRYGVPMLGTIRSPEMNILVKRYFEEKPVLFIIDKKTDPRQVEAVLREKGIEAAGAFGESELLEELDRNASEGIGDKQSVKVMLVIKAGAHNGKRVEKALDICRKFDAEVTAGLLWEADERLISAYELPEHVLYTRRRLRKETGRDKDISQA
ncbi:MAG: hypothetical protein HFI10_06665 [Lachnospiraceae bacterium]|jgi:capsular polysaccharide biosynthesis protein|nr:hypothetical protein [Lachnospiraceae bacterium]